MRNPVAPARAVFDRAFAVAGLEAPALRLEADALTVVRSVLLGSDSIALLSPLQIVAELASGVLGVLPVALGDVSCRIGVTTRNAGLPSAIAATAFWVAVAAWVVTALGMGISLTGPRWRRADPMTRR